jgi:hypothetical protein
VEEITVMVTLGAALIYAFDEDEIESKQEAAS